MTVGGDVCVMVACFVLQRSETLRGFLYSKNNWLGNFLAESEEFNQDVWRTHSIWDSEAET